MEEGLEILDLKDRAGFRALHRYCRRGLELLEWGMRMRERERGGIEREREGDRVREVERERER